MISRERLPALLSSLAALAIYAVSLAGSYVYDDRYVVQLDPRVQDVHKWGQYWTKDYFNGGADNLYRPLTSMTYAIESKLHGNGESRAWIFHLINCLLHAGVSAAVAELALRMTRKINVALLAGLIFALHPIHVEAVANIVGRAELMCGLGMLGALVLFLRPLTNARVIAIWLCFVFALLSKEQGMLLPLLLLALAPLSPGGKRDQVLLLVVMLMWTAAGYILFRERILKFWWDRSFLDPMLNPMALAHGIDRVLVPIAMLGRYLTLMIAPSKLAPDYGGRIIGSHASLADPYLYLGIVAFAGGITGCAIAAVRRAWAVFFCLISFGLLWGMVSNMASIIGINFAERLMYIPSAFVAIFLAMALALLPLRWTTGIAIVAVVLFSLRTVTYAWEWNDRIRFYEYSVREWPDSAWLRIVLATEQADRQDFAAARDTCTRARELEPDYFQAWVCSAKVSLLAGDLDEALRFAQHAHRIHPSGRSAMLMSEIFERLDAIKRSATTTSTTVPTTEHSATPATTPAATSPATHPSR